MRDATAGSLLDQVLSSMEEEAAAHDDAAAIRDKVEEIERSLGRLLNAILHHPRLQALEATWRGLHGLVREGAGGGAPRVQILDLGKEELGDDLLRQGRRDL